MNLNKLMTPKPLKDIVDAELYQAELELLRAEHNFIAAKHSLNAKQEHVQYLKKAASIKRQPSIYNAEQEHVNYLEKAASIK